MSDIQMDSKQLNTFLIGLSAHVSRLEEALNLPELNTEDYSNYSYTGGNGSYTKNAIEYGDEILQAGNFFEWVQRNIERAKNIKTKVDKYVKPVLKNEVVRQGLIENLPYGNHIDTVLTKLGYAYDIKAGAYRLARGNSKYSPDDKYTVGQYYKIKDKLYLYTENGFVDMTQRIKNNVKGAAYAHNNDVVVDSSGNTPLDFLQ